MTDNITLVGVVATPPKSMHTPSGLSILSFRLASSQRRYDRAKNEWVDGETNWYTVTAFRQLADNAAASLSKGDRVVVAGRLRVRAWESGDRSGTNVEVDADSLGPDLLFGTTSFTRVSPRVDQGAQDPGPATPGQQSPPPSAPDGPAPGQATGGTEPEPRRELVGAGVGGASSGGASSGLGAPSGWHTGSEETPF